MGDFLGRLAERALGQAAVARPVLAPVFAPVLASGEAPGPAAMAPAAPDTADPWAEPWSLPAQGRHREGAQLLPRVDDIGPEEPGLAEPGTSGQPTWPGRAEPPPPWAEPRVEPRALTGDEPPPPVPAPPRPGRLQQPPPSRSGLLPVDGAPETARAAAAAPPDRADLPATTAAHRTVAVAQPPAGERRRAPQAAEPSPLPTIQVSIGRVEVRAVSTPYPAPHAEAAPPVMTLQQYLQQRSKGGGR